MSEENIEAIEQEKEEYLEDHPEEDVNVEEIEFGLTDSEIEEWIGELTRLKEEKGKITLSVDEETDLIISYEEDSGENGEEDQDDGE